MKLFLILISAALASCKGLEKKFENPLGASTTSTTAPAREGFISCEYEPIKVETRNRSEILELPMLGQLVAESHYVTIEDGLLGYPKFGSDRIEPHLRFSCASLASWFSQDELGPNCDKVYTPSSRDSEWRRVWTPSENGLVGQGAVGEIKPPLEQELWQGNMYFKKLPKRGEKWLAKNPANGRAVVIAMGWEMGPGDPKFIGGVTVESAFALRASNTSQIIFGKLKDQSLPYGPVVCPN